MPVTLQHLWLCYLQSACQRQRSSCTSHGPLLVVYLTYYTSVHGCLADICYSVWKSLYMAGTCLKWAFSPTHYCSISIMCCSHLCIVGVSGVTKVFFLNILPCVYTLLIQCIHTRTHMLFTHVYMCHAS